MIIALQVPIPDGVHAAGGPWALCGTPALTPDDLNLAIPADQPVTLSSDKARFKRGGVSVLYGNVGMQRGPQDLTANQLRYYQPAEQVEAQGDVHFNDRGLSVNGPHAQVQLNSDQAQFDRAHYRYTPRHARGEAEQIRQESNTIVRLKDASYTTCAPNHTDWLLKAGRVKLDKEAGVGTARNVTLRFKHVPFLYTPWLSFPLDNQRKSGFLAPTVGSASVSGLDVSIPYYWNIAPDRDATFTPRILGERGLQLQSQFRYLYPRSEGGLNLAGLDDSKTGNARWLVNFHHQGRLPGRLRTNLLYNRVSDDNYFEDLGDSLSDTSTRFLQQRGDLSYSDRNWRLLARAQAFQTVDETISNFNAPYQRLPQLLANGHFLDLPLGIDTDLHSEYVRFQHDERIDGGRLDLFADLERPFTGAGYFVTPRVKLRHTRYSLNGTAPGADDSPTRTLPRFSLDSGLQFERPVGDSEVIQTLEPRLFYQYAPQRDQGDIPIFDTGLLDFSFAQLFREDRFSGPDRIENANQLSYGLTSRFLNTASGHELFSASLGQIYYFDAREVNLPGRDFEDDHDSDIAGQLSLDLDDHWSAQGAILFDPGATRRERSSVRVGYQAHDNRIVTAAYRFRRDGLDRVRGIEQTDLAFAWPLGRQWHALGRWNHDVRNNRILEILGGIEYESCCWKLRLAARRFINDASEDYNTTIQFQLVLKGLTRLGSPLGNLLEEGILGYKD